MSNGAEVKSTMLERYISDFDPKEFLEGYLAKQNVHRTQAMRILRQKVPKESFYQNEVRKRLKQRYPTAFIRKIAQGEYSEAGIPDIMMIYRGHYFGFEIKRPIFGTPSGIQKKTIADIERAGGTGAFVTWAEEAFLIVDQWRCGL